MQAPDPLNDQTTYQRCFACGARNESGLQLVFRRAGDRVVTDFTPQERHQGFPGVLHGGILATLLDETLSRTGALRGEWLMTGRIEVRFKRPAPIGRPLRAWGTIVRERAGALDAVGAVELEDGSLVADARGIFVRLPEPVRAETLARYPEFLNSAQA